MASLILVDDAQAILDAQHRRQPFSQTEHKEEVDLTSYLNGQAKQLQHLVVRSNTGIHGVAVILVSTWIDTYGCIVARMIPIVLQNTTMPVKDLVEKIPVDPYGVNVAEAAVSNRGYWGGPSYNPYWIDEAPVAENMFVY